MKYQRILFIFCALYIFCVAGTTDDQKKKHRSEEKSHYNKHRNQKAHGSNRNKKTENRIHSSSHFQHLNTRDSNQNCHVVCKNGSKSNNKDIEIIFNGDVGLVGYLNQSASGAAIQDYFLSIVVLFNGQDATAIVEDLGQGKFYSIDKNPQSEELLWSSSKSDFKTFFGKQKSLEKFVKLGAEHGKVLTKGEELIKAKFHDLSLIGYKATDDNYNNAVDLTIKLNTTLRFLFKGQGEFIIHKNIIWFVNVTRAFGELFSGRQSQLQSADLKVNLTKVYGVSSGVEALVNLLIQVGTRVDLAQLLRNELNSPDKLVEILANLTGGSTEGLDGIVTVVLTVIKAVNGRASINDVITLLLDYKPGEDGSSLTTVVDEALDLIESQSKRYNNGEAFKGIVTVLRSLNSRNFVYRNINISDIIKLLASRNPVTVVQVFIRIFTRFASTEGFSDTLRGFLEGLNTTSGTGILRRLFPGTDFGKILHCVRSILSNIPIIGGIFKNSSSFNVSGILGSIPVVGPSIANSSSGIISGIEHAVENVVGPIFGSGQNEGSSGSTPAENPGSENTKSPKSGETESPNSNKGNASISTTEKPDSSPETESPNTGNHGTKPPCSRKKTSPPIDQSGTTAGPETTKSGSTAAISEITTNSAGSTKESSNSEKEKVHEVHEKKGTHTHLHAANRKENVHTRHKQHEKEHHGHLHESAKKENSHSKHNLQEKNSHHGHLRESNRHENVHYRHKAHDKDSSKKIHSGTAHEKKHGDHNDHV